ncbi:MAG: nitrilase-related carbon-nitrogen hydrolase [Gemmatimonadaceae bacterium]|nr:nitrilase-related carbon-nitrogen hydrolase [Gemmatimonadaceae bacterium]
MAQELGVVLVVPIYEKQAPGLYRNSAAVIDADGALLGTYRKMHIPHDPLFEEKYYFAPGDVTGDLRTDRHPGINGFRVWQTKYANIGVLICWDQWYPEGARITALLGADILFYPTAIGWHPAEKADVGRGAGRRVAHGAARARDRQRRLRGVAQPRGLRAGARHRRHRVLRPVVHLRSVRPLPRAGRHRSRGARGHLRSRVDRGDAPQLAVPARPARRCVRTRSSNRWLGGRLIRRGFRM